jgi:hypothetical protein
MIRPKNIVDPTIGNAYVNGLGIVYDPIDQIITLHGTPTADTTFLFANPLYQVISEHTWSLTHVSGSYVWADGRGLWANETGGANQVSVKFPAAGQTSVYANGGRQYASIRLFAAAGAVFTQYKFHVQCEFGTAATDWNPYRLMGVTLLAKQPMFGATGAEDEIGNDGHEIHRTALFTLNGSEAWTFNGGATAPTDTTLARFSMTAAGVKASPRGMSSHFAWSPDPSTGITAETMTGHGAANALVVYVKKSRMAGWSDGWSDAQKATAFKTLLQSWTATPLQAVAELTTPITTTDAPVQINGMDGITSVTNNSGPATINYIGSGWAVISGKANSLYASATQVFDANGLRIDQTLVNGTTSLDTYFHAGAQDYGLYKKSDGSMIAGAGVDIRGNGYFAANQIRDPSVDTDLYCDIKTKIGATNFEMDKLLLNFNRGNDTAGGIGIMSSHQYGFLSGLCIDSHKFISFLTSTLDTDGTEASFSDIELGPEGYISLSAVANVNGRFADIILDTEANSITIDAPAIYTDTLRSMSNGSASVGTPSWRYSRCYVTESESVSSDERLKQDITDETGDIILKLRPRKYRLIADPSKLHSGFIAQEVYASINEINELDAGVFDNSDPEGCALVYSELISPMIAIIQQQQRRIDTLERRLTDLETLIESKFATEPS